MKLLNLLKFLLKKKEVKKSARILMCEEDMSGWKLEELLLELNKELNIKSQKIISSCMFGASFVVENNNKIIELLEEARLTQLHTMKMLDAARGEK